MRLRRAHRSSSSAIAAVALLCILTSCGTSSAPTQTSPGESSPAAASAAPTSTAATVTPSAACADAAELKSSLEALTQVRPLQDGVTALTTAIDKVKSDLDTAQASAAGALQPSVQQVKTAFAELQAAASGLSANNIKGKAPAIAAALKQLGTATKALSSTIAERCPGS